MERLDCTVKEYAWGKHGEESEVARLFAAGHSQFRIGESTPYAELWIGTHPDGPARVRKSSECLSRLIARSGDPAHSYLFNNNIEQKPKEDVHLPFIMKIMSIRHTLSLQVHPTKEQAAILHQKDPINYPDRNHKPELAYALTRFELLCGFRPANQIVENMKAFPELRKIMGEQNSAKFEQLAMKHTTNKSSEAEELLKAALRQCFTTMLEQQVKRPNFVIDQLKSLYRRLDMNVRGCLIEDTVGVMLDTYERFPTDVGCFAPLYLNHMILQPGECCFYAAEELHAYLSGECVECVGNSNNTLRVALTPKYIDRENLVKVLNYRMTDPEYYMVPPQPLPNYPHVVEYAPDCKDFQLHQIEVTTAAPSIIPEEVSVPALQCASMLAVVEGEAEFHFISHSLEHMARTQSAPGKQALKRGDIFYVPPGVAVRLSSFNNSHKRLLAYRTFSYEAGPDHSSRITVASSPALSTMQLQQKPTNKSNMRSSVAHHPVISMKLCQQKTLDGKNPKLVFGIETDDEEDDKPAKVMFDVESEMDGFC